MGRCPPVARPSPKQLTGLAGGLRGSGLALLCLSSALSRSIPRGRGYRFLVFFSESRRRSQFLVVGSHLHLLSHTVLTSEGPGGSEVQSTPLQSRCREFTERQTGGVCALVHYAQQMRHSCARRVQIVGSRSPEWARGSGGATTAGALRREWRVGRWRCFFSCSHSTASCRRR